MMPVTVSTAKKELHRLVGVVQGTDKAVVITKRGTPAAVLMSYAAYESYRETALVSSDGSLMRDIRKGLRDLRTKRARLYSLEELFSNK